MNLSKPVPPPKRARRPIPRRARVRRSVHVKAKSTRRGQALKADKPKRRRKTQRQKDGERADKIFSLIVRHPQVCTYHLDAERGEWEPLMGHGGHLQCAHLFTRGRRSTRWTEENAMPLCGGAHKWFTHNPDAWKAYLVWKFGQEAVDALDARSLELWDGDLESVLVRLAARAVALGIPAGGG